MRRGPGGDPTVPDRAAGHASWQVLPFGRRRNDDQTGSAVSSADLHDAIDGSAELGEVGRARLQFPLAPIGEFRQPENAIAFGVPIVSGSLQEVLEGLSVYKTEPFDDPSLQPGHPGMDQRYAVRSMRLFAEHVLPEIQRWPPAAGTA